MKGHGLEPRHFDDDSVANVGRFGEEGAEGGDGFAVAAIKRGERVD